MVFLVNDVLCIKSDGQCDEERILWISNDNEICSTIKLNVSKIIITDREMADINQLFNEGVIELCNDKVLNCYTPEEKLTDSAKKLRDKAFEIIKYIFEHQSEPRLFDAHVRRKIVLAASSKFNITDVVVYKYLRKFWQGGKLKNSLIPDYDLCGGVGIEKPYEIKTGRKSYEEMISGTRNGIIVDKKIKVIFETVINRYYKNSKEMKLTKVYELMIKDFFCDTSCGELKVYDKSKIPTFRQFEYWYYKNRDLESEIKNRKGNKKYSLDYRPLHSNSTLETFGPGHRYQLDATVADVYLVSRINRSSIIGRPIVYLVVDVFSRLICGIFVGLEGPSWNGAASAIYNCSENKVEFCKKFEIEITNDQWPDEGLPQIILGDRGEMVGPIGEKVVEELNITLENTPSYRGDAKGIVEQKFNALNYNIKHWTPGAIKQEYRERGERDYRLDAKLDIDDFTKIIIHAVLEKNNNPIKTYPLSQDMIKDGVNPIPTEIWKWGMKNRTGILRRVPDDLLKISLMRSGSAVITKRGIVFHKVIYNTNLAVENEWYLKARALGQEKVDIVFDNRDMSTIFIIYGKSLIPCTVKEENQMYINKTYEEIEDLNYNTVVNFDNLTNQKNQNALDMNVNIDNVIKGAVKKCKKFDGGKKNVKGIRENRKNENIDVRKEQSLSKLENTQKNVIGPKINYFNDEDKYDSNAKSFDFIRKMRNKRNEI